jgi:hypothetical protein
MANFIDTNRWFHDRQPNIILVWQLSKQDSIGLTTGKPILFHFGDRLFSVQVATLTNQKKYVKNSTIKSPKWGRRPNNREKRLPKPLGAWKPGWTFYSVSRFLVNGFMKEAQEQKIAN